MTFEEILPKMKQGNHCYIPSLTTNYFYFVGKQLFVNDGLNDLPIYGLKTEYILSNDWILKNE